MPAVAAQRVMHACCPSILRGTLARIEGSELGYRLAKGTFWSMTGAVVSRGLMLVASVFVARTLGKTGFGELGIIQSTVGMFGVFAGFGLGLTATKYIAEFRESDPKRAGRIVALSSLVAVVTGALMSLTLLIFAPWLAQHAIVAPHLTGALQISAWILFVNALNGAQTGALAGFEAFRAIARVNLFVGVASFPILVGGAYLGGLIGAVWALLINLGINWVLNHIALRVELQRHGIVFALKDCGRELPVLWRFSLPAAVSGAIVAPLTWACNALLVNQANGYAELGVYSAILRMKQVPEAILAVLMAPILPILSEKFGKSAAGSYNKTLSYAFSLSLAIVVPVSLIQMASPALTLLPFGSAYQGHHAVVQWLMLHAIFVGLFSPMSQVLASMNRMWFACGYNLSWSMAYLLLAYLLVPTNGASGLAAATALAHFVTSLPCVAYIYRYERAFIADVPLVRHIASVFLLLIAAIFIGRLAAPPLAGAGGAVLAFLYLLCLMARMKGTVNSPSVTAP